MAGTILGNVSLGASDWSTWIMRQERGERGYMRVSLTNFSGTAASSIATGSVMEMAGSIYSFTETAISLATATASASVAVYFYVIPSAGGTTCTVEMNSIAPVWRDDYQGFYASAASTTRVIGGCYIGTAATYYNKYLYTEENLIYCLQSGETRPILTKIIEIGEWNMDGTAQTLISHNLVNILNIRRMCALVRSDGGLPYFLDQVVEESGVSINIYDNSELLLERQAGSLFDSVTFNATASTVANRGWVYIEYEA